MPATIRPFKEDFFERIVDVNWMMEPKVFWIAGGGMFIYTSPNGKKWNRHRIWHSGDYGHFDNVFTGLYMRTGFNPDGDPLWILAGTGTTTDPIQKAALQNSSDGLNLDGETRHFDYNELCQEMFVTDVSGEGGGKTTMNQTSYYVQLHELFTSTDGLVWTPQQYHPDPPLNSGGAAATPASGPDAAPFFVADGGGGRSTHYVPILVILTN